MADISGITGSTAALDSKVDASKNKLAKDLNSFLQLLTSQLKNQDPLSPMDSSEFTNQLVEFAQVEQQIGMNDNLTNLIGLTQQSIVSNAVNYMGHTVEGVSSQVPLQDGHLKAAYGLTEEAKAVTVVVRNEKGDIVLSKVGETTQGVHAFEWDGMDQYGIRQPDGVYSIGVTALAGDDTTIDSYVTAFGRVTGVTTIDNKTILLLDKVGIPIDKILSVSEAPKTTSNPDPEPDPDPEADPEQEAA